MEFALENLNPEIRDQIELLFEDDQLQPKNAVTAFNKLTDFDDIDVVINFSSATTLAISSLAESKQIPLIGMGVSDFEAVKNKNWVVRLWVTPEVEGETAANEALKHGFKKIAVIETTHPGVQAITDSFRKTVDGQIDMSLDAELPLESKDFKSFIAKIKSQESELDAIYTILFPGQLGLFAKQLHEANITLPLFGHGTFEDQNEVDLSQGALIGSWYANVDDPASNFTQEFTSRFPEGIPFLGMVGHDAIALIAAAISEKGTDSTAINDYLHNVKNFQGAMGTFSSDGNNGFNISATIKMVTADGFIKIKN